MSEVDEQQEVRKLLESEIEKNKEFGIKVSAMTETLIWCDEYFTARDEMNAKVHCAPVRLSPLTERVRLALGRPLNGA